MTISLLKIIFTINWFPWKHPLQKSSCTGRSEIRKKIPVEIIRESSELKNPHCTGQIGNKGGFFHGNQLMAMMYVGGISWIWSNMQLFRRFVARNFRARIPNLPCTVVHGNSICAREPPYGLCWPLLLGSKTIPKDLYNLASFVFRAPTFS